MLGGLDAGPAKDKTIPAGPHLEQWFREYYECLDWDQDTGAPTPETLQRLDMAGLTVGRAGA
jgi:aldehyde:ferredoxin oxidoreductase